MERDITCGECKHFGKKRIVLSRKDNPFRLGRLRGKKFDFCLYYDQPAKSEDFYGLCEVAIRKPVEVEPQGIATADPVTDPPLVA